MTKSAAILAKIEKFQDRHAMEDTPFGVHAAKDSHLIPDLRRGERKFRRATIKRILDFMAAYKPKRAQK